MPHDPEVAKKPPDRPDCLLTEAPSDTANGGRPRVFRDMPDRTSSKETGR